MPLHVCCCCHWLIARRPAFLPLFWPLLVFVTFCLLCASFAWCVTIFAIFTIFAPFVIVQPFCNLCAHLVSGGRPMGVTVCTYILFLFRIFCHLLLLVRIKQFFPTIRQFIKLNLTTYRRPHKDNKTSQSTQFPVKNIIRIQALIQGLIPALSCGFRMIGKSQNSYVS